jgi:hypothetical protein
LQRRGGGLSPPANPKGKKFTAPVKSALLLFCEELNGAGRDTTFWFIFSVRHSGCRRFNPAAFISTINPLFAIPVKKISILIIILPAYSIFSMISS